MSVKNCSGQVELFRPLIESWIISDPEGWQDNVRKNFNNAEDIIQEYLSGAETSPAIPVDSTPEIVRDSREAVKSELNDTINLAYIGEGSRLKNVLRTFSRDLVSACVLNISDKGRKGKAKQLPEVVPMEGETMSEAEERVRTQFVNSQILEYKNSKIETIKSYVQSIGWKPTKSTQDENIVDMLDYFASVHDSGDTSEDFKEAYDAYTILTRFDDLLSQHAPFITVNQKYKSDSPYTSERRYRMADLSVKQFQSFSLNEYMDASDSISMISKVILKNIPEINEDGKEYGAVGISGWMSVMSKLRLAITDSDFGTTYKVDIDGQKYLIAELTEDQLRSRMKTVIESYIDYLKNSSSGYAPHKTYLLGKLRGIASYVFASGMPKHFKAMFTHMMMKTVPSSYVSYVFNENDGNKVSYITERPVLLQRNFLSDTVDGSAA